MDFYRRNLPHWQPDQAEFFVTFRLADSLPLEVVKKLNSEREILERSHLDPTIIQRNIFAKYEKLLDKPATGPTWLEEKPVANIVCDALHYRDQNTYDLYAYCVMPNHVHLMFRLLTIAESNKQDDFPVTKMLQNLKRYTAVNCNKVVGRKGQFWQHESFDRVIRDNNELENTLKYVLNNPVKVGLTDYWQKWPFIYCKPAFLETFK